MIFSNYIYMESIFFEHYRKVIYEFCFLKFDFLLLILKINIPKIEVV